MKCSSCGGEINLTDQKCPHCGRLLTETAGYQADLNSYTAKGEKAKRGLSKSLSGNVPLIISAVVMVALLVGIGIASYVKENAYHFRSDQMRKEAAKKYDAFSAEINKYLESGDYTGFAAFKEYHNIAEWEAPYDDLNLLWDITEKYTALVSGIEGSVMFGPEARIYRPEDRVDDCHRVIRNFYHEYEYNLSKIEVDPYAKYMRDMKEKADVILKVYLGMDDAEREAYLAASDIEQEAYLEEVLLHE